MASYKRNDGFNDALESRGTNSMSLIEVRTAWSLVKEIPSKILDSHHVPLKIATLKNFKDGANDESILLRSLENGDTGESSVALEVMLRTSDQK